MSPCSPSVPVPLQYRIWFQHSFRFTKLNLMRQDMFERRNKTSMQVNLRTILIFPTSMSRKKLSLVIYAVLHSIMLLAGSRLWYYSPTQGHLWRTVGKELFLMRINLSSISCLLYAEGDISLYISVPFYDLWLARMGRTWK